MKIVTERKWQRIRYMIAAPLGKDRTYMTACQAHVDLSREAAREGMVLLKNEKQLLPFHKGQKLAVFGKACRDYVKGGGGSGFVRSAYERSLLDGMNEKKVTVFTPLRQYYDTYVNEQYAQGIRAGVCPEPELPDELVAGARAFTDTAIIAICRFSGENLDRTDSDFYLTAEEKRMVGKVLAAFDKVVIVLNIGGMMDTSWFREEPRICSALLAWQGGMEGGSAVADILCGDVCPSGRLTDTLAESFGAYPSSETFRQSSMYTEYTEDIFVGYRYFETIPGAKDRVCYPFGYGLSYTEFTLTDIVRDGLTFSCTVTNTGNFPGKEVVQLYCAQPQGRLDRPTRVLAGFIKTHTLAPGESQKVQIAVQEHHIASYDETTNCWLLEKGCYDFYIGNNIRQAEHIPDSWCLNEDRILQNCSAKCVPQHLTGRLRSDGTYETYDIAPENRTPYIADPFLPEDAYTQPPRECPWPPYRDPKKTFGYHQLIDVYEGNATVDDVLDQMSDEQMIHLLGGQPNRGAGNTFGIGNLQLFGVPNVMTADGPAGLRFYAAIDNKTTAFPCATQLACSWNKELLYRVGASVATEVRENGMGVWLAPAVNIHRSPLCGRNFEYMSEDPLLSGQMASAMIEGVQSMGVAACLKHFACNNREENREDNSSVVSQRALREIYLKAFEICVRDGQQPWAIMASYNLLNGIHTSSNRELLTDILRDEWGFDGVVTTDWFDNVYQYEELAAGCDLKMGTGLPEHTLQMLHEGNVSKDCVRQSAKRILELILKLA